MLRQLKWGWLGGVVEIQGVVILDYYPNNITSTERHLKTTLYTGGQASSRSALALLQLDPKLVTKFNKASLIY